MGQSRPIVRTTDQSKARQLIRGGTEFFSTHECTARAARVACPGNLAALKPLLNPKSQCWYAAKSISHCKLDETISRMCERAGIPGYKTNHSLCATNATWFYQAGVNEQLIMERTGHISLKV